MSIYHQYDTSKKTFTIKVMGDFNFGEHQSFRKTVEHITPEMDSIVIDLQNTAYMDSSALGMLLVMLDKTNKNQQTVKIININSEVRKLLDVANFDKLCSIT